MNEDKFIYFGKYPQTYVRDVKLRHKLDKLTNTNSKGYYEYDNNEYVKINANPYKTYFRYNDNSIIRRNKDAWFKVEPVRWRIIHNDDSKYTLLCEELIDAKKFTYKFINCYANHDYEDSLVRNWLNNEFYNICFTNEEKELIIENPNVLNDKVWILGKEEVNDINSKSNLLRESEGELTDYTLANNACVFHNGKEYLTEWWLRSSKNCKGITELTIWNGCFVCTIFEIQVSSSLCVRPSIIVKKIV